MAHALRHRGWDVFDDWIASGSQADVEWTRYEKARGRDFVDALDGEHAHNVFEFDYEHLMMADTVVMVLPAGKSAHLEIGFAVGAGKSTHVILDKEPEKYDIMYRFVDQVWRSVDEFLEGFDG